MTVKAIIRKGEYHDSVTLMLVSRELSALPGVLDAAVMMATEANKTFFKAAGLLTAQIETAGPNDLAIAFKAPEDEIETILSKAESLLQSHAYSAQTGDTGKHTPKTIRNAVKHNPTANVVVISVPGQYAADEAWRALLQGMHVLLFSDNVSLEDEIALKRYASQEGLLLMGPGAGTAIINGIGLGFANQVPRGPVGIVSAAGTGLQEVSCLLAKHGVGISQAIGTGGRDLSESVGGVMMLQGLHALQQDPESRVIVLISKPPTEHVAWKVLKQTVSSSKPTVVCFLGAGTKGETPAPNIILTDTLRACAHLAAKAAGVDLPDLETLLADEARVLKAKAIGISSRLKKGQKFMRGLFSGGTLCYEAQVIWSKRLTREIYSNAPLHESTRLPDSTLSIGHTALDLGEEEFTIGRPHPMISNDLRIRRLRQEAQDPETAVILLDLVLGYGAHPDPASELAPNIESARIAARDTGRELAFIASITGTSADPQDMGRQIRTLENAGVQICDSNAAASQLAVDVVLELKDRNGTN